MAVTSNFRAFVEDQLGRVVKLRSRAMFGGVGLYADDVFFALLDDDVLYFKVDDATRPRYEARGMKPFQPPGEISFSYFRVPGGVLEDVEELRGWAEEAVEAARRSRGTRSRGARKPAARSRKRR
jgi:DNA transformation protein